MYVMKLYIISFRFSTNRRYLINRMLAITEFCDFEAAVIKWPLNSVWYNFGLKSYIPAVR